MDIQENATSHNLCYCCIFLVSHDQFLYEAPVGKITVAKMISSHEVSDDFQNKDRQVTQELSIKVLNAKGAEPGNLNLKTQQLSLKQQDKFIVLVSK
ncbi:hypothetical protein ACGO3R_00235 [Lactococcus lactis]